MTGRRTKRESPKIDDIATENAAVVDPRQRTIFEVIDEPRLHPLPAPVCPAPTEVSR